MQVPFFARRFPPQVEQSLKVLPHRCARSCRTADQNRCDWIGWLQLPGALYFFVRPSSPVVTGIHQLTRTGKFKSMHGYHQPVTDGTRVYFDEVSEGKWRIAQVAIEGGEVSYIETELIQSPFIKDI